MKYSELAQVYEKLSSTAKRLEKTEILSEFLKKVPADETEEIVLLLQGRVFPAWDEREIGVAAKLVLRTISLSSGADAKKVVSEWKKTGDLGETAQNLLKKKQQSTLFTASLSVKKVFSNLQKLSSESGSGSVDRKLQLIAELLTSSSGLEAKYLVRTVIGDLRIGIGEG